MHHPSQCTTLDNALPTPKDFSKSGQVTVGLETLLLEISKVRKQQARTHSTIEKQPALDAVSEIMEGKLSSTRNPEGIGMQTSADHTALLERLLEAVNETLTRAPTVDRHDDFTERTRQTFRDWARECKAWSTRQESMTGEEAGTRGEAKAR